MSDSLQHQKDADFRVTKAAPHPRENGVNPKEYYMTDPPPNRDIGFYPHPGKTHVVFYTTALHDKPTVTCHALENWQAVSHFMSDPYYQGMCIANKPEQLVAELREKADQLERWLQENPQPAEEEFQGMPYAGMYVWVEHPGKPGEILEVRVSGTWVSDGEVCVTTEGFKYFRPGDWFWNKAAAQAQVQKA